MAVVEYSDMVLQGLATDLVRNNLMECETYVPPSLAF
jgi:hypothetical protein